MWQSPLLWGQGMAGLMEISTFHPKENALLGFGLPATSSIGRPGPQKWPQPKVQLKLPGALPVVTNRVHHRFQLLDEKGGVYPPNVKNASNQIDEPRRGLNIADGLTIGREADKPWFRQISSGHHGDCIPRGHLLPHGGPHRP